ncbi:hypothetical protein O7623_00050 [Solwaraspora sp. WMMD791]|uniref:hypothetical protein n=1 Tax=Solwaraspora sp. WMMD791 TaxID=3016086 RepID=UPI00249C0C13|nr:hypothetical protein [Solwaraspora sp. WMMD791]WFE27640.1 hypothetical protein O7623_31285 [Solwaraspora sp. WMMD791]WFE27653.1 hypothetical protein O7623_00050 [Solwaraspora sp. WMMD791]
MRDWTPRRLLIGCAVCFGLSVVAFLLLLMVNTSIRYQPPPGQEAPKVTDWMQAWGSIGGILAGLLAAGAAAALLMHERQQARLAQQQLAQERAEADVRAAQLVVVFRSTFAFTNGPAIHYINATVQNFSATPIHNVIVVTTTPDGRRIIAKRSPIISPSQKNDRHKAFPRPIPILNTSIDLSGRVTIAAESTVYFTDSSNTPWAKQSTGEVARTTSPYPIDDAINPF